MPVVVETWISVAARETLFLVPSTALLVLVRGGGGGLWHVASRKKKTVGRESMQRLTETPVLNWAQSHANLWNNHWFSRMLRKFEIAVIDKICRALLGFLIFMEYFRTWQAGGLAMVELDGSRWNAA